MRGALLSLLAGAVAITAAVVYVLLPLLRGTRAYAMGPVSRRAPEDASSRAIEALREIEFDRETGKLSDADYTALKASYTERAIRHMRQTQSLATAGGSNAALETHQAPRLGSDSAVGCPECGGRPDTDAAYCSKCGRYQSGVCASCGAVVTEPAARFCTACGGALAAKPLA